MRLVSLSLASLVLVPSALAQRGAEPVRRTQKLEAGALPGRTPIPHSVITRPDLLGSGVRPKIMLAGYWPPTNEMLRRFSDDPTQNPMGWIGSDWEGRGYDVYSYFPEFSPPNCFSCGQGTGDFEVDYQDTSADFWPIANALEPIAIITFSRGAIDMSWEVEMNQYNRNSWVGDYTAPFQPTPSPPDAGVPAGHLRLSALPVQEIVDAVTAAGLGLDAFICFSGSGGGFLSEFMAYHGVWYQALHDDPSDPAWCIAGGHVHVGGQISWPTATLAAEVTLRTVMDQVDGVLACSGSVNRYCATSPNSAGAGAVIDSFELPSISANQFGLSVSGSPAGQFGLFYYGTPQVGLPFGDGLRCAGGTSFRLNPALLIDGAGSVMRSLDVTAPPLDAGPGAAVAGSTVGFQFWYRDPAAAGAGFNLSDALEVTWCP